MEQSNNPIALRGNNFEPLARTYVESSKFCQPSHNFFGNPSLTELVFFYIRHFSEPLVKVLK